MTPVYVGGTQGPSLGTPVAVYDSLIEGGPGVAGSTVEHGTAGELVAPLAFPNMPGLRTHSYVPIAYAADVCDSKILERQQWLSLL